MNITHLTVVSWREPEAVERTEDIGKRLLCRVVSLQFQEIPWSVLGSLAGWALGVGFGNWSNI